MTAGEAAQEAEMRARMQRRDQAIIAGPKQSYRVMSWRRAVDRNYRVLEVVRRR